MGMEGLPQKEALDLASVLRVLQPIDIGIGPFNRGKFLQLSGLSVDHDWLRSSIPIFRQPRCNYLSQLSNFSSDIKPSSSSKYFDAASKALWRSQRLFSEYSVELGVVASH